MRSPSTSIRRSRRLGAVLVVAITVAAAGASAATQPASATVTNLKTFTTPGTYTWKVPTGVTNVTFDVYGAGGGGVVSVIPPGIVNPISDGGPGGEAKGKFAVHAGETFEIVVGGEGATATVGSTQAAGGFNGGGHGDESTPADYSGGGGGASDVRIGGRGNTCAAARACTYENRIIVGGGGGGGSTSTDVNGEAGGGLTGGGTTCLPNGGPSAMQTCAGDPECQGPVTEFVAGFGFGGPGCSNPGGGGGGAGWYGGASGEGVGGGGSGYISQLSISGSFPAGTTNGNGKVIITTTT